MKAALAWASSSWSKLYCWNSITGIPIVSADSRRGNSGGYDVLLISGFPFTQSCPANREYCWMVWARSYLIDSYNLSRSETPSGVVDCDRTVARAAASSIAWAAPCPWSLQGQCLAATHGMALLRGVKGWAASPRRTSFPDVQFGSFSMSSNCQTLTVAGSAFMISAFIRGSKSLYTFKTCSREASLFHSRPCQWLDSGLSLGMCYLPSPGTACDSVSGWIQTILSSWLLLHG